MVSRDYDYVIVGAGAAGLHLVLAMNEDVFFNSKKILIIEKSQKNTNDKTWCFWEKGEGKWDDIITQLWNKSKFITHSKSTALDLGEYRYKMIRAIDFYTMAKKKIQSAPNIDWVNDEVSRIKQSSPNEIVTPTKIFTAKHVFDSRIDPDFFTGGNKHINLLQHFKGWVIETKEETFDPDSFTMMDFSIKYPKSTSFTYILPYSSKKALVEFTFFSPFTVTDHDYDHYLKEYVNKHLDTKGFSIVEEEKGTIPMSNYPFFQLNNKFITKIGTAGSWVKSSSGYSFKNAERYSKKIIDNIKLGELPSNLLFKNRFKKYDAIFLDVLYNNNHLGEEIFSDMYTKNDISKILAFLDEETTIREEMTIIKSLPWLPFIKAFFRQLKP
jgi:lycopene beta-cyclase